MKILLVDDHELFRKSFMLYLKTNICLQADFVECKTGEEAMAIIEDQEFDLVFLDVQMPKLNGHKTADLMLWLKPSLRIIMLSMICTPVVLQYFFKVGVAGYLTKDSKEPEIRKAVDLVLSGQKYFPESFLEVASERKVAAMPKLEFSFQEIQVIQQLAKGFTNKEVADKLGLSPRTVESYRATVMEKARVKNIAELIGFFYENGLS